MSRKSYVFAEMWEQIADLTAYNALFAMTGQFNVWERHSEVI